MRLRLTSIMVNDQDKALKFYTDILGFHKKHEIPLGEFKWLTVISPEGPDELELSLEPNANPAGKTFQDAMFTQKIPVAALESSDIEADYQRLTEAGVVFQSKPQQMGPVKIATFADTCGNWIQIYQPT
ncbi:MAG TPA: VOC family protein [Bryobacteraceae bacterium]|nr:glyoxalase [Bryobacterales bacterium]HRJ21566.1 VOC family protein [Bryobacteraceae bacterium]